MKSLPVFLAVLAVTAQPAAAQENRAAALANVTRACKAETLQRCPALDPAAPQPRNAAICLKPYKSSLSFACRRAVKAVYP